MKIRKGFVSNSSSSSYTCLVCGNEVSGYDMGLRDAEMYECVNGHYFCDDHMVGTNEDHHPDSRYGCSKSNCPICQLQAITDYDLINYLLWQQSKTRKDIEQEVKAKYPTYEDFVKTWKPTFVSHKDPEPIENEEDEDEE